jgi:hypothetical protein
MLLITAEAGSHQAALPWRILPVIAADSLARSSTRPGIDGLCAHRMPAPHHEGFMV